MIDSAAVSSWGDSIHHRYASMSSASSALLSRSIYSTVEHIRTLIQTVHGTPSSSSSSSSISQIRRKGRSSTRRLDESSGHFVHIDRRNTMIRQDSWIPSHAFPKSYGFPVKIQGRFREDYGSDRESKDGNHHHQSFSSNGFSKRKEPSLLLSLIQEIQPLDSSQISKDASPNCRDAMKRTISGMLGLLPSDQFHVSVETSREPLAKLLVSSMMTGYTLRNAEYRLCLDKSLAACDDVVQSCQDETSTSEAGGLINRKCMQENLVGEEDHNFTPEHYLENPYVGELIIDNDTETLESLGPMSKEARDYIQYLEGKLKSISKELEDCKEINTGLQVQSMVGEESNELLDYLRSLAPDKVEELSQPTSQEVEEVIEHIINGILNNPTSKLQEKDVKYGNQATGNLNGLWYEDYAQKCSFSPLQSQSALTMDRDYLARLLFWCILLGHHMRGLEYRLELSRALSLTGDLDTGVNENSFTTS